MQSDFVFYFPKEMFACSKKRFYLYEIEIYSCLNPVIGLSLGSRLLKINLRMELVDCIIFDIAPF